MSKLFIFGILIITTVLCTLAVQYIMWGDEMDGMDNCYKALVISAVSGLFVTATAGASLMQSEKTDITSPPPPPPILSPKPVAPLKVANLNVFEPPPY